MLYLFEDYSLDTECRELRRGADVLAIEPQVFDLLAYLIANCQRVISKDELLASVWRGRVVSESALNSRLSAARSAIGDRGQSQRLIRTLARKGYRFVGEVRQPPVRTACLVDKEPAAPTTPLFSLPDKPSIAVLAFTNLSSDPEQEYLAAGIAEDIITELARFTELFVIARNSSFRYKGKAIDVRQIGHDLAVRYVLEGSVRRSGDHLRISAQLIDVATGAHRWAEYYDRKHKDLFALQDEVVRAVVSILAVHLRKAEIERGRSKPPGSWQAYDYYLQASAAFLRTFSSSFRIDDLYEARRLLQNSIAIDPNYARAYALLANSHVAVWHNALDDDFLNSKTLTKAHQLACKAVQLDPNLPQAHASLGHVRMYRHDHEGCIAAFERAIALNPNYLDWRFGLALVYAGYPRRAIKVIASYVRADPFHTPVCCGILGLAHYMLKQYAEALVALREYITRAPNLRNGHVMQAATHAQLGQMELAGAAVVEVLRREPDYTIAGVSRRIIAFKDPRDDAHFFTGLRKAGLPA